MSQYFVVDPASGQKYGPADISVLNQWAKEGRVNASTILEDASTGTRVRPADVPGLLLPGADAPTSIPQAPPGGAYVPPAGQSFESPYPRPGMGGVATGMYPPGVYFEYIGKSWDYIKPNLGLWIVAVIIMYMISSVISAPFQFLANIFGMGNLGGTGDIRNPVLYFLFMGLSVIISIGFSGMMTAGLVGFALDLVDGKPADIGRIFRPFKSFIPNVIGSLASWIPITIGFLLCVIPGFYFLGRLGFTNILITEQGMDASEALRTGWEKMGPFAWAMGALWFVASIVSILGLVACCIGVLVTIPFLYTVLALQYRTLFPATPISATGKNG